MRSLTGILFKGVLLGVAVVFLAAGTALYFAVRMQLVSQLDRSLLERVEMLASSIEYKPYGLEADLEEMRIGEMEKSETPGYLYIILPDGRSLYRSAVLAGIPFPGISGEAEGEIYNWVSLADGERARSILYSFIPEVDDEDAPGSAVPVDTAKADIALDTGAVPGEPVSIQFFMEFSGIQRFLHFFLMILLCTGMCSMAVLSYTVRAAIKKGARPVSDLAASIGAIRDDDLTVRINEETTLKELTPVVSRLNDLLERLEQSFKREKTFTSDAAHELRTPLAGLKSTVEVALNKKRENEAYLEALGRVLGIVNHMEGLVGRLLVLARLESGQESPAGAPVDLEVEVTGAWIKHRGKARECRIDVSFDLSGSATVFADADFLGHILDEIFGNAVYYTNEGGSITVAATADGVETVLSIGNTGSGVASSDALRVFDRFWRASSSRSEIGTRFGLGLPIARMMTEAMGGRLEVETQSGGEFKVFLTLPGGEGK